MDKHILQEILARHALWYAGQGGKRANLAGSNLARADLSFSNLARANLAGSNLARADLSFSNLAGSNLARADLSFSNLAGSNLSGVDLSFSNLSFSNLAGSNLSGVDLSFSNLAGANLAGSNLALANLSLANLSRAKGIVAIGPGGSRGDFVYAVTHGERLMCKVGCHWFGVDEFTRAVQETYATGPHRAYYDAVLTFLRARETELATESNLESERESSQHTRNTMTKTREPSVRAVLSRNQVM